MAEKFDFDKHDRKFAGWAFIAAITKDEQLNKQFNETFTPGQVVDIELKFNGVEVSFLYILKRLEEEYDREVQAAAKELLDSKFRGLSNAVDNCAEELREVLTQAHRSM